jgi:hypothetical protein
VVELSAISLSGQIVFHILFALLSPGRTRARITPLDYATLMACKLLLVCLETIQWGNIAAVTQRSESGNTDIDTNRHCGRW